MHKLQSKMKKLNFLKMPSLHSLMTEESFAKIYVDRATDWEKRDFGWYSIPRYGADFTIKTSESIKVNGVDVFNFTIFEYVREQVKYATSISYPIQRLKDLVDKVEPISASCTYSSDNSLLVVNKLEGYNVSDFPGLVKDSFTRLASSYLNIDFNQEDKKITDAEVWKRQGKCPQCGYTGKFFRTALICHQHGIYAGF